MSNLKVKLRTIKSKNWNEKEKKLHFIKDNFLGITNLISYTSENIYHNLFTIKFPKISMKKNAIG